MEEVWSLTEPQPMLAALPLWGPTLLKGLCCVMACAIGCERPLHSPRGYKAVSPFPARRHDIIHIDLHCCSLLNETNTQNQAVAFFFAQENPLHSLQRTSNHFHVHAFVQIPKWPSRDC